MRELEPEEALKLIDELTSAKCHNCARLTALLERTKLAKVILRHQFPDTKWSEWGKDTQEANMQLADRLIAYLKPLG